MEVWYLNTPFFQKPRQVLSLKRHGCMRLVDGPEGMLRACDRQDTGAVWNSLTNTMDWLCPEHAPAGIPLRQEYEVIR